MIVNQGVQIYNDAMEKITMTGQLTELAGQFSHLKEQALGTVGAITQPFTDLSSIPTEFIGVGLSWKNDFTGVAREEDAKQVPALKPRAWSIRRFGTAPRSGRWEARSGSGGEQL